MKMKAENWAEREKMEERERRMQHTAVVKALDARKQYAERERRREKMKAEKWAEREKKMEEPRIGVVERPAKSDGRHVIDAPQGPA